MTTKKRYLSNSVEAALALARRELGQDALLVGSGPAPAAERAQGAYEVIFEAPVEAEALPEDPATSGPPAGAAASPSAIGRLEAELGRVSRMLSRVLVQTAPGSPVREFGPLAAQLHAVEMPPVLIGDLLDAVERRLGLRHRADAASPQALRRALAVEIASRLAASPGAGVAGAPRRIAAFAGPPGSGKTTTIAKLAMRLGVETHTPTLIVSADSYRIAAAEQLRTYAAILGVPFQLAETPGALARAIEENRHKDLVLIDTPGFGEGDGEAAAEWSAAVAGDPGMETQLVLSAAMRTSALQEAIDRFQPWRPARLVLTGLDMTAAAGGALGAAMAARLPVGWLGTGQSVPEDLEPATTARLETMLLGAAAGARSAVA